MKQDQFVIGVDYGTDSVRSILVNASTGSEIASSVFYYPRWRDGLYCDPSKNQFRQHPQDYIDGLTATIKGCLQQAGASAGKNVRAISVDTTGSTPIAVDKSGTPLAFHPEFKDNPNAMFVLWKDHTSTREAAEINEHAEKFETNFLQFVGGIYSSEWFWAKLLHVLRHDTAVRKACHSWVEHCDWIPFLLTGGNNASQIKRGVCSAGHKALWAAEFGGLPPIVKRFFKNVYVFGIAMQQEHAVIPINICNRCARFVIGCAVGQFIIVSKPFAITYCANAALHINFLCDDIVPDRVDRPKKVFVIRKRGNISHSCIQISGADSVSHGFKLFDYRFVVLPVCTTLPWILAVWIVTFKMSTFLDKILSSFQVFLFLGDAVKLHQSHFYNLVTRRDVLFVRTEHTANKISIF